VGIGNSLEHLMRSRLLCLLPLLLVPSLAAAFSSSSSGNATTYSGFTVGQTNVGKYAVSTASDGTVLVNSGGRLNVTGGGSIPINVAGSISRPSAAAAVGRFLGKSLPILGAGYALYELAQELGFTLSNNGGPVVVTKSNASTLTCTVAPCTGVFIPAFSALPTAYTKPEMCQRMYNHLKSTAPNFTYDTGTPGGSLGVSWGVTANGANCYVHRQQGGSNADTFQAFGTRSIEPQAVQQVASSSTEFVDAIAAKSGWPTTSKLGATVKDALVAGDALAVGSPVVSGPATAPVSTTTTVDPATGNTTTTIVQISNTYSGPTVTTTTTQTTSVKNTSTGAPVGQPTTTTTAAPVTPVESSPSAEPAPFAMPCGVAGTPPCGVKVDEDDTPDEVDEEEFKPMLDEAKQAQEELLDTVAGDADKSSLFDGFSDLFVTPALAECVPLEIPGDRGSIDPCGTVGGARAIMAYIWALSGLGLCLHMVRKAL